MRSKNYQTFLNNNFIKNHWIFHAAALTYLSNVLELDARPVRPAHIPQFKVLKIGSAMPWSPRGAHSLRPRLVMLVICFFLDLSSRNKWHLYSHGVTYFLFDPVPGWGILGKGFHRVGSVSCFKLSLVRPIQAHQGCVNSRKWHLIIDFCPSWMPEGPSSENFLLKGSTALFRKVFHHE